MTRHKLHILSSIICILLPIVMLSYVYWDVHQPKVGPVGDGRPIYPSVIQLVPPISCFLIGVTNLPLAIMRYKQKKREQHEAEYNQ